MSWGDPGVGAVSDDAGYGCRGEEVLCGECADADAACGVARANPANGVRRYGSLFFAGVSAVFCDGDEPEVVDAAVGAVVVDVVYFQGVVEGESEDAVCGDPYCAMFEDGGFSVVDADGCDEVAVGVCAEWYGVAGAGVADFSGGEVVLPFTGDVFVPGEVVAGVDAGGVWCHGSLGVLCGFSVVTGF